MDKCILEEHDLHVSDSNGILFCLKCDYEPMESEIWKLLTDRKKRTKALEGLLHRGKEALTSDGVRIETNNIPDDINVSCWMEAVDEALKEEDSE